ncbi:MAG: prepilin-type N-terminal cleavage/methylation domain-containing protein [Thermodesulfobacteriota bacterium]
MIMGIRLLHPPRGFTLLEVMVALSIIAIVLTAVFHVHSQTVMMAGGSQFYTVAPLLAQEKMAEIEAGLQEKQEEGEGDFGDRFDGYRFQFTIQAVESETLGPAAADMKRIDVTVSANSGEQKYTLRSYRFGSP